MDYQASESWVILKEIEHRIFIWYKNKFIEGSSDDENNEILMSFYCLDIPAIKKYMLGN